MGSWSKPVREALEHPLWQVAVAIPTLACAAAELILGSNATLLGQPLTAAHGVVFLALSWITRGVALAVIPAPARPPEPSLTGAYPYAAFRPVRAPRALPPPLPDNIIPFQRRADVQEPEAHA